MICQLIKSIESKFLIFFIIVRITKKPATLDYQDSNLDKQNQNLLCYHYTIVQTSWCFPQKTLQR